MLPSLPMVHLHPTATAPAWRMQRSQGVRAASKLCCKQQCCCLHQYACCVGARQRCHFSSWQHISYDLFLCCPWSSMAKVRCVLQVKESWAGRQQQAGLLEEAGTPSTPSRAPATAWCSKWEAIEGFGCGAPPLMPRSLPLAAAAAAQHGAPLLPSGHHVIYLEDEPRRLSGQRQR